MESSDSTDSNYQIFRECLSSAIVEKSTPSPQRLGKGARRRAQKAKRNAKSNKSEEAHEESDLTMTSSRTNPEELAEFIDFLATEIFTSLPPALQTISYSAIQHNPTLTTQYATPLPASTIDSITGSLPPAVPDTLKTYSLLLPSQSQPDNSDQDSNLEEHLTSFLSAVLNEYIAATTKPPPVWINTRADACEICERDWIPLSYHHLIPRGVHEKVRRRGWHDEWVLNSVAWLCRACHSFVHRMASNEELAREWFTVERMWEREDVRVWAAWVGRVRWKST